MPRQQTFLFISHHLLNKDKAEDTITVSFNPNTKYLIFSQRHNPEINAYVGKYVQFYADIEKKTLAWSFANATMQLPDLKHYTQIKRYGKEKGTICAYIPSTVIAALKMTHSLKKQVVGKYKPSEYLDNNTYYYIKLT